METRTKIIIGFATVIGVGATVWFLSWIKKNKKGVRIFTVPQEYDSNPLVKNIKSKTNYILGTIDTMQLKNGVIVNKNNSLINIGLLQGIWRMHTEEMDRLKKIVSSSNEPNNVKEVAYKLIENANDNNSAMFDPKFYNRESQWYKDYLSRI
jgi:hypothetical protein